MKRSRARHRLEVEQAEAGDLAPVGGHVATAEELQPGAHGEHGGAALGDLLEPAAAGAQVVADGVLHAVLPAADEEEVAGRRRRLAQLDLVPAQRRCRATPRGGSG